MATLRPTAFVLAALAAVATLAPATGRAQVVYTATLSGAAEIPPNASAGTGTVAVGFDPATSTMAVSTSFSGLSSGTTVAHIHCCTATPGASNVGVATPTPSFPGFPAGVTAGSYSQSFDMAQPGSYNAAFLNSFPTLADARAALVAAMGEGRAYFNLHTAGFPGGELRGNLFEQPIFADGFGS
ncbi:MAG: CHRD domain-containing protein [Pseudoxanthomonas sp.]|nr:CHRD domain-containing protein [Pseudoxanthomonas sp.]